MTPTYRISRRLFLASGSGVLGVAVLGACSSTSAAPSVAGTPSTTAPTTGSTTASTTASTPASSAGGATGPLRWEQVPMAGVSAYLLIRGKEVALVDTGNPMSDADIAAGLKAAGADWGAVRHVIMTHNHPDHAGGWESVEPHVTATAYTGQDDVAGIGASRPVRGLKDGDEIFGLQIIATPGHTAGHICVYDPTTGVLVAGDALRHEQELEGANPAYTADTTQAAESVRKLARHAPKVILVGHGSPLQTGAATALTKLAATI